MAAIATKSWSTYMNDLGYDPEQDALPSHYNSEVTPDDTTITLPPEIFTLIAEQLDEFYDEDTLISLCLVSRVWCQAAQPRLFTRIHLFDAEKCGFWSKKFTQSPHLSRYVKEIKISDPKRTWFLGSLQASNVASFLTNVEVLHVEDYQEWGKKEQSIVKMFQGVKHLDLKDIAAYTWDKDLPELVFSLPLLERLDVESTWTCHHWERGSRTNLAYLSPNIRGEQTIKLKEIGLHDRLIEDGLLDWLGGSDFDLSQLHTLTLGRASYSCPFDKFIARVADHARYLSIHVDKETDDPLLDLQAEHSILFNALNKCTFLTTLTLCASEDEHTLPSVLHCALGILRKFSQHDEAPRLETITLSAGIKVYKENDLSSMQELRDWQDLDDTLTIEEAQVKFPVLRSVEVSVHVEVLLLGPKDASKQGPVVEEEDVFDMIESCLPQLDSRGMLDVRLSSQTLAVPPYSL
ncbi:hypothetical protein VNI00_004849 [Paramarasmius palmivorus]|uniref:F-box domain-containing protein n=1 Tax=Paramarasmius palmivorus TaxID=297713 RepID=A0AAW0DF50_9AGAR